MEKYKLFYSFVGGMGGGEELRSANMSLTFFTEC